MGFVQVPPSFSEKSDVSSKEIKERSKLKSKINNTQSELNDIIDLTEDKETKSTKDKDKKKEMFTTKTVAPTNQISNSISFSGGNVPNYNQQFFDYKSFKAPTKRKNSGTDTLMIKKSKKHSNSWIKKESNKPKHNSPPKSNIKLEIDSMSSKSGFSDDPAIDINQTLNEKQDKLKEIKEEPIEIKEEKEPINSSQSSFNSLEFNSRIQSKVKQNNFDDKPKSTNPTSAYAAFIREKKSLPRQRQSVIEGINNQMNQLNAKAANKSDLDIEIQPIEEVNTYDEFYQLKRGKKNSMTNRRSLPLGVGRNVKVKFDKKERQKMTGHKCELCQKFYETLGENPDMLCEECSRHRTDQKPSSTPKGFYDLTI